MFKLEAEKNSLTVTERELLTSGSEGVSFVDLSFSEDWTGLEKTAVFRAGDRWASVLLEEDGPCAIPRDVLVRAGKVLRAGVFGIREGEVVLPTVWAELGYIQPGARLGGEAGPAPGIYEELLEELKKRGDRLLCEEGELKLMAGEEVLSSVPMPFAEDGDVEKTLEDIFSGRQ